MPIFHRTNPRSYPRNCPICGHEDFYTDTDTYSLKVKGNPKARLKLLALYCGGCDHVMFFVDRGTWRTESPGGGDTFPRAGFSLPAGEEPEDDG